MTKVSPPKYAPAYDLFKLIVAVILTIILILLLLRGRRGETVQVIPPTITPGETTTPLPPTETAQVTSTFTLTPTLTAEPTFTATLHPTFTATDLPTDVPTATPDLAIATPSANTCPAASSRIKIGDIVRVTNRLNFRVGPGLRFTIILTNNRDTKLEVIGGPVCTPVNLENGETKAHIWWMVKMEDGTIGWSAEGQLLASNYLLEPSSR